jgi:hypothetical protein
MWKNLKTCLVKTDGKGLWGNAKKNVKIFDMAVENVNGDFGELRVYFDTKTWDVSQDGLIYTDKTWLKGFREKLEENGFSKKAASDVDYSEQGMQGDDYVSLDCGVNFLADYYKARAEKKKK